MDQICLVVPVLPGRTAGARDFTRELEADATPTTSARSLYQWCGSGLFPCVAPRRACRYAVGWGEVCARRRITAARAAPLAQEHTGRPESV